MADPIKALKTRAGRAAEYARYLGPAFVASVAYVDPGNFATNIEGGAKFGYLLIWVVLASNLMAMVLQTLAAKLGIATGRNLAEQCRDRFPRPLVWALWVLMEIVAMATDLAEFVGAALGFALLFHIPLIAGAMIATILTFWMLSLQRFGYRAVEASITALVAIVAVCYVVETWLDRPDWAAISASFLPPRFAGTESMVLAAGILGATVMPHAIFLHSALTQDRLPAATDAERRRIFGFGILDVFIAMGIAGLVNAAMLVMASATFHGAGLENVSTIEEAHRTLEPLLGSSASWIFALSLVASGVSSTVVGTMSGQIMMQGFVHFQIPLIVRRLVTLLPSFVVILAGVDVTRALVLSQVVLCFALPFAILPLVWFTARRTIMGPLVNHPATTAVACVIAAVVIVLNLSLLIQLVRP